MILQLNINQILSQDIGFEDLTTNALIPPDLQIKGRIVTKESGIVAGVTLASAILNKFSVKSKIRKHDGENLDKNDVIMVIEGDARTILSLERTILNFLMRMSGIATITSQMVEEARKVNPEIIIAGTRKTSPGIQFLEKDAIRIGGGDTHRYRLDDMILIKDNHLVLVGDVYVAVKKAKKYSSFSKKIEIEVENINDTIKAVNAGADIILMDNMGINDIKRAITILEAEKLRDKVLLEVSGGINLNNIAEYAKTGVDIISSGYITHSAPSLDISLEINGSK